MHPPPPISAGTLIAMLCLLAIFLASTFIFFALERRWTQRRGWIDLADWARGRRFKLLGQNRARLPEGLGDRLANAIPQVSIARDGWSVARLHQTDELGELRRFNILARRINVSWPTTALRPARAGSSIADGFSLGSFPTLAAPDRFLVLGLDPAAARRLVRLSIRGLLPPDIGLVINGDQMLLEFSDRPFDPIELERLLALADQVVQRLPPAPSRH